MTADTVFLDHLGVACVDMESRIDAYGPYGVYHRYDGRAVCLTRLKYSFL